jgi:hypothetical protein
MVNDKDKQYNQYSMIQRLGEAAYPPLSIRSADRTISLTSTYIFLENYSETYTANWDFGDTKAGDINLKADYSKTDRHISISFTLGARNVHEAKKNLDFCRQLARATWQEYEVNTVETYDSANDVHGIDTELDALNSIDYEINFGTFLRDQRVIIESFEYSTNFDAGVFDYGSTPSQMIDPMTRNTENLTVGERSDKYWASAGDKPSDVIKEDSYVYHGDKGGVLPKSVTITISMKTKEDTSVGFGGKNRAEGSVGWSLSAKPGRLLDWPHGTGPIPAAEYCQRTSNDGSGNQWVSDKNPEDESVSDENTPEEEPQTKIKLNHTR